MGAARKIWDDAKARVPSKGWDAKLKIGDFGPRLDDLDKQILICFQKIKLLQGDIAKCRALRKEAGVIGKSYRKSIKDCGTLLSADQKTKLLEGSKGATHAADSISNQHRLSPLHDLKEFLTSKFPNFE